MDKTACFFILLLLIWMSVVACRVEGASIISVEKMTDEERYDELKERKEKEFNEKVKNLTNSENQNDVDYVKKAWVFVFGIYDNIKSFAPLIIICCEVSGVLTAMLAKSNKKLRRKGIYGLCITVPALVLLFVFGMPYLYDLFNKI